MRPMLLETLAGEWLEGSRQAWHLESSRLGPN
jgi:hypothetical protein